MSIFKDTLKPELQNQLKARQNAIFQRTPDAIQYFNSRNAWVRMSSSVNVNGSADLAKNYVLLGGTLDNGKLRSGVGTGNEAYSLFPPVGEANRLGVRLMPGITGIEVKSKSAYGSLREVTVNFNAWDIRQLEDLELLYMRPGYTVLIEWGWAPYLDNNEKLKNTTNFYDILNRTPSKEQIFKELYNKAVKEYSGNYDAHFGYVKNYSWSARPDGGYDCTTTIISVGEIIESLKINYVPHDNIEQIKKTGLLASQIKGIDVDKIINSSDSEDGKSPLEEAYSQNILAGLFYELFQIGQQLMPGGQNDGANYVISTNKNNKTYYYDLFKKTINIVGGEAEASGTGKVGASDDQIYITLEGLCNLINSEVTFKDSNSSNCFIECSVHEREYDKDSSMKVDPLTGEGYLKSLAHPLQISVDPTICVIKSPVWSNGFTLNPETVTAFNAPGASVVKYSNTPETTFNGLIQKIKAEVGKFNTDEDKLIGDIVSVTKGDLNEIKELSRIWHLSNSTSLYDYLDSALTSDELNKALGGDFSEYIKEDPAKVEQKQLDEEKKKLEETQTSAIKNLQYLNNIGRPYFLNNDPYSEMGIIGNIYINLNYLYRLSINKNLESQDKKEKNDINLYSFLKQVLAEMSSAIGNVGNFDIHVDPIDSKARIIDINYVDSKSRKEIYNSLFTLEMHNTKSTVRTYKLESQIFPDQSTTIAIGAQAGGGAMATDNNTMLDFNKGITDRIIPKKIDPSTDPNKSAAEDNKLKLQNITTSLKSLYEFFGDLSFNIFSDAKYDTEKAGSYKNALKDLINFFKNLTKSDIKNRAIIPTKLSIQMDGLGGLVIGHMFKIPEVLLPKGYRGETLGSKLGYIITGIGHSISNDWTTTVDAQTVILDDPTENVINFGSIVTTDASKVETKPIEEIRKTVTNMINKANRSKVGATAYPGDTTFNTKYKNGYIPITEMLAIAGGARKEYGGKYLLHPEAANQYMLMKEAAKKENLTWTITSAYRSFNHQQSLGGGTRATVASPGRSPHGWGGAIDILELYSAVNGSGNPGLNATVRANNKLYLWLKENGPKYNWYNPYRLADGGGVDECWHWEYWGPNVK